MRVIPPPPPCLVCGGSVGLWEPIIVPPDMTAVTSWLRLAETGHTPEPVQHQFCPHAAGREDEHE